MIKKLRSMGRGAGCGALVGLVGGLALAMPGAASPGGVMRAVIAGTSTEMPAPPSGPTTTVAHHEPTTTTVAHHEPTTTVPAHPTTTVAPHDAPTTVAPGTEPTTSGGPRTGDAPSGTCDGHITSFAVTVADGGRALRLTVMVSGQIGWMSAYARGFGGAALAPVPGGFAGVISGPSPVAPGTEVVVGSCGGHVRASTKVGGASSDTTSGTSPTPAPSTDAPTTTAAPAPHNDLAPGCGTATITSVAARLRGGGSAVTVTVMVDGTVGGMSAGIEGLGGIAMHPVPGGFAGTLTVTGTVPVGATVVVGACGGRLRAIATVVAA
ncbi:MAG TPA: hypothetical protein VFA84_13525 [Acidimicrobiales bacterium]|nr:hypothetical protein [Acidimicrobiales bacterium]